MDDRASHGSGFLSQRPGHGILCWAERAFLGPLPWAAARFLIAAHDNWSATSCFCRPHRLIGGGRSARGSYRGPAESLCRAGFELADRLLEDGGREILREV